MPSAHTIILSREVRPTRTVVTIWPRRIDFPSAWFPLDQHAEAHALTLQKETGWPLVDRREQSGSSAA